jgi:hypothetical protein
MAWVKGDFVLAQEEQSVDIAKISISDNFLNIAQPHCTPASGNEHAF